MTSPRTPIQEFEVPPFKTQTARVLKRQCPVCGGSGIYQAWISIKSQCPTCGYVFMRESGYFLGALAVNIVVAELISMAILVGLLIWTAWSWWEIELAVLPLAFGLPFLLIPYARGFWMALDLRIHPNIQR